MGRGKECGKGGGGGGGVVVVVVHLFLRRCLAPAFYRRQPLNQVDTFRESTSVQS